MSPRCELYIGFSDVTVIYGRSTVSVLWGDVANCVKLSGEDFSHYSNIVKSVKNLIFFFRSHVDPWGGAELRLCRPTASHGVPVYAQAFAGTKLYFLVTTCPRLLLDSMAAWAQNL